MASWLSLGYPPETPQPNFLRGTVLMFTGEAVGLAAEAIRDLAPAVESGARLLEEYLPMAKGGVLAKAVEATRPLVTERLVVHGLEDLRLLAASGKLVAEPSLHLAGVTDAHLGLLADLKLPDLKILTLSGRELTPSGLSRITMDSFPGLSTVELLDTRLNPSVVNQFQRDLSTVTEKTTHLVDGNSLMELTTRRPSNVAISTRELIDGQLFEVKKLPTGPAFSTQRTTWPKPGYKPDLTQIDRGWGRFK
jgi:hypothetical protein